MVVETRNKNLKKRLIITSLVLLGLFVCYVLTYAISYYLSATSQPLSSVLGKNQATSDFSNQTVVVTLQPVAVSLADLLAATSTFTSPRPAPSLINPSNPSPPSPPPSSINQPEIIPVQSSSYLPPLVVSGTGANSNFPVINPSSSSSSNSPSLVTEPNANLKATTSPPTAPLVPTLSETLASGQLYFGTFQDSFVGSGSLDLTRSTIYLDSIATALYFPPNYKFIEASQTVVDRNKDDLEEYQINDFFGPYNEKRCLGNNCLESRDKELFYNGQVLVKPSAGVNGELMAISLGTLSSKWLVGFTYKQGASYVGQVYHFDGQAFTLVAALPVIESTYFGPLGFGGSDGDFLVIYGGSKGIAYHIKNNQAIDISRFFDYRVMFHGFKAEVMKVGTGNETNWYIFSSTRGNSRFIKLWQNKTAEIAGGAVYGSLFASSVDSVVFKFLDKTTIQRDFLAKVKENNQDTYYLFSDLGFKNQESRAFYSLPITHDGNNSQVTIKKIVASTLELDESSRATVKLYFSIDGQNWQDLALINHDQTSLGPLRQYFLRVAFPPLADRFSSPYLASILFDYYCQK